MITETKKQKAKRLFSEKGPVLKAKILNEHNFSSGEIAQLLQSGDLHRIKAGYYAWAEGGIHLSDLEIVALVIPYGVVCGYSAAVFHELSSIIPSAVSLAVPSWRTRIALPESPPVEIVPTSSRTFMIGCQEFPTEHAVVRVYDKERTVCDFFRKRNRLGMDMALEILQNYMEGEKNLPRLFEYATKLRIKKILLPYIEALA